MAAEERFVSGGTNDWLDIFPKKMSPVKVTEKSSTVIKLLFLIPALLMVVLVIVLFAEKMIGKCNNPDQIKDVVITDTNEVVQHLGVVSGSTPVARRKEAQLQ